MIDDAKPIDRLTIEDVQAHPVWQYANRDESDETLVRPVKRVPVAKLTGRIVGTQVQLANGERKWALIGNVDPSNARLTEHFLTLSVAHDGQWFTLARYHDVEYVENGPDALARFLARSPDEVFPIAYNIQEYAKGDPAALVGRIYKQPRERLSRAEIIALAVP